MSSTRWPTERDAAALQAAAAALLATLQGADLQTRRAVHGRAGGQHRGLRRGGGVEFAEHRAYAPGDDLRRLDWRALARQDRLFIKRFEEEVHASVTVLLDGSGSMALRDPVDGGGVDKWAQVQVLAAAVASLVAQQGDALGLVVAGQPDSALAATSGPAQLRRVLERVAAWAPTGPAGLEGLTTGALRGLAKRGAVVAFSDVLSDPEAALAPLSRLRRTGPDVVLVHTLHPLELRFAFSGSVELVCAEASSRMRVEPRVVRQRYVAMIQAHCDLVRERCVDAGVHYVLADLGEPLVDTLAAVLKAARGRA